MQHSHSNVETPHTSMHWLSSGLRQAEHFVPHSHLLIFSAKSCRKQIVGCRNLCREQSSNVLQLFRNN